MSNECCVISEGAHDLNNWTEATLDYASEGNLGEKRIAIDTSPRAQKVQKFLLDHFRDLQIEITTLHKASLTTETPYTSLIKSFDINFITLNEDVLDLNIFGCGEVLICETDLDFQETFSNDNIKSNQEEAERIARLVDRHVDRFFSVFTDQQGLMIHLTVTYRLFANPPNVKISDKHVLEWNLNVERDSVDPQEVLSEDINIV